MMDDTQLTTVVQCGPGLWNRSDIENNFNFHQALLYDTPGAISIHAV